MSRLLLDTTFFIDLERSDDDLDDAIDDEDDIALATITVAELRVGALLADGRRKAARMAYVDDIVSTIPMLEYDLDVAEAHAALLVDVRRQGKPRGAHDMIIAATARASERTIVSADGSGFRDLPGVGVWSHR